MESETGMPRRESMHQQSRFDGALTPRVFPNSLKRLAWLFLRRRSLAQRRLSVTTPLLRLEPLLDRELFGDDGIEGMRRTGVMDSEAFALPGEDVLTGGSCDRLHVDRSVPPVDIDHDFVGAKLQSFCHG